jgi:hypothetical protein
MELLVVITLIISLVVLYFLFDGSIIGIIISIISLFLTNSWQGTNTFLLIEEKIDKTFYFND